MYFFFIGSYTMIKTWKWTSFSSSLFHNISQFSKVERWYWELKFCTTIPQKRKKFANILKRNKLLRQRFCMCTLRTNAQNNKNQFYAANFFSNYYYCLNINNMFVKYNMRNFNVKTWFFLSETLWLNSLLTQKPTIVFKFRTFYFVWIFKH